MATDLWGACVSLFRPGPPIPAIVKDGLKEEDAKKWVGHAVPIINKGLGELAWG